MLMDTPKLYHLEDCLLLKLYDLVTLNVPFFLDLPP